jgi:hypothetical protein
MAIRAHNVVPADAYREFKLLCVRLDGQCAAWQTAMTGNITADDVWLWYRELYYYNVKFTEIALVPGIVEYATTQEDDPLYDIGVEFGALLTALVAAHTWLYAAIPRDVNGYTLTHTTTVEGDRVPAVYTTEQTAAFGPYLTAIAVAIA